MTLRSYVTGRRWLWSLVVLALAGFQLSLGQWQWERYQLRLSEQAQLTTALRQDVIELTAASERPAADQDLHFRRTRATGTWDLEHQLVWVGPMDRMEAGPHLVTPLLLGDNDAILVDRGWISAVHDTPAAWSTLPLPDANSLQGLLVPGRAVPDPEVLETQERPVLFWSSMDLEAMQEQIPWNLRPYYLHLEPAGDIPSAGDGPVPTMYRLRTPPSMHLSYVVQWGMSALTILLLYILIIRFLDRRAAMREVERTGSGTVVAEL